MKIKKYKTKEFVNYFLNTTNNKQNYNLLLSGGNTPIPFYTSLASATFNYPKNSILTDERAVKPTSKYSNATMLKKTKLLGNLVKNSSYYKILTGDTFVNDGGRVNNILKNNFTGNNIMLLGIGLDGHIAGIMPESQALVSNELFEYNSHLNKEKSRLTITKKFIQDFSTKIIVLVNQEKVDFIKANLKNTSLPLNTLYNQSNVDFVCLIP